MNGLELSEPRTGQESSMLLLRLSVLSIALAPLNGGCERYKPTYQVLKKGNGEVSPTGKPPAIDPVTGEPLINNNTEIQLMGPKLLGQANKYEALVKFGGVSSARTKLESLDAGVKLAVKGLPTAKADVMVIEIYEADKLKFIAKRAATELPPATAKANMIQISDCLILKAPWDGLASSGSCDWDIEEAK
jgi:hypothetical protein